MPRNCNARQMRDKLINAKKCLVVCMIITMFSGIAYAGPNSSATCGLGMNFSTTIPKDLRGFKNLVGLIEVGLIGSRSDWSRSDWK